jgi:hypothetical protein
MDGLITGGEGMRVVSILMGDTISLDESLSVEEETVTSRVVRVTVSADDEGHVLRRQPFLTQLCTIIKVNCKVH